MLSAFFVCPNSGAFWNLGVITSIVELLKLPYGALVECMQILRPCLYPPFKWSCCLSCSRSNSNGSSHRITILCFEKLHQQYCIPLASYAVYLEIGTSFSPLEISDCDMEYNPYLFSKPPDIHRIAVATTGQRRDCLWGYITWACRTLVTTTSAPSSRDSISADGFRRVRV